MKKVLLTIVFGFLALFINAQTDLDAKEFQSKYGAETKALLVDVRQDWELKNGFISGAVNYDFMDDNFLNKFKNTPKDFPIYVYCASGGRSGEAAELLTKAGYKKVYNLKGGMRAWVAQNLPVRKP